MTVRTNQVHPKHRLRHGATVLTLLSVLLSCACSAAVAHTSSGWVSLGSATVRPRGDVDVIQNNKTSSFSKIQLRVSRAPVVFRDVKVHFADGSIQDVKLRNRIGVGGRSREIDLRGGQRKIARISFSYRSPAKSKRFGVVTVLAKP